MGGPPPDPYRVLVSELMLQQTQVATVIPYFHRFMERLPTLAHLAEADEQTVLRLWQGLGYYSRARNLQKAARKVISEFGGQMPQDVDGLLQLPGVGRYTAGAIASIAFGRQAPILDGNVMRVLCRLDAITADPRLPAQQRILWQRATDMVPAKRPGDFNSALMELGATVCTPRSPKCLLCPVRDHCEAATKGIAEQIPPPKKAVATPVERRVVYGVRSGDRWLIEQRPSEGRWASLWQFPTRPASDDAPTLPVRTGRLHAVGRVRHQLTHRSYIFEVRYGVAADNAAMAVSAPYKWVHLADLAEHPMSKPQLTIATLLQKRANDAA